EDATYLGTPKSVDGLVGVADHDQVAAVPCQGTQKFLRGGVGVLVLVDEHDLVRTTFAFLYGRVGKDVGGDPDQFRVVERGHRRDVEPSAHPGEEGGGGPPVVPVVLPAEQVQVGRVKTPFLGPHEEVTQFLGETARLQCGAQPLGPV